VYKRLTDTKNGVKASANIPVSCQNGFIEKSGQCWKIFDDVGPLSWSDAKQFCNDQDGAHLAEIKSYDEDDGLKQLLPIGNKNYWIGLKGNTGDSPESFTWIYRKASYSDFSKIFSTVKTFFVFCKDHGCKKICSSIF